MKLYFQGRLGHRVLIKESNDEHEIHKAIYEFCLARDFTIYYTREWEQNGERFIDVGSHSEFFVITDR